MQADVYADPGVLSDVVGRQLSDYCWLPTNVTATHALMVDYQPSEVAWMCTSADLIAHLIVPYAVQGLEQGAPVTRCALSAPIPEIWGRLRDFS